MREHQSTEERNKMNNSKKFSGKVVLVTGGTSGIGKTTAIEFARAGAKVVVTGRREKEGAQVVDEIKKLGGDAVFVRTDVAKDADVKAMVDFTLDKFGRLDVAFNNAGVEYGKARLIRPLKLNTAEFSTSTFGAFSIRCVTKSR
jgi:NAD(P)-dependent dehydrogenase (short-subunit alcohol dehydrogenase family)